MSTAHDDTRVANPFASAPVVAAPSSATMAALMQRETAEIQAAMAIAKKFPRDQKACVDRIVTSFSRATLAEQAMYSFSRGGSNISGLSIRALEEIARNWGNIVSGVKELSRMGDRSEVLAYAWDLETGFKDEKIFQVRHWRDKKNGQGYIVTDERDIYEVVANVAARRKRACMEAVIPGDVREVAERQAVLTLKTKVKITPELIAGLIEKFGEFGVTQAMIEKRIQRRIQAIEPGHVIMFTRIYNSLRDNMAVPSDFFEMDLDERSDEQTGEREQPSTEKGAAGVKSRMRSKQANKSASDAPAGDQASPKASAQSQRSQQRKPAQQPQSQSQQQDSFDDDFPQFDEEAAVKALKSATSIEHLSKIWTEIALDYDNTNREVEPSVDQTYKEMKRKLTEI